MVSVGATLSIANNLHVTYPELLLYEKAIIKNNN